MEELSDTDAIMCGMTVDFRQHLSRQLNFLRSSAAAYDSGYRDEAYRIAVAIRVLIHNAGRSVSILHHLGSDTVPLLSTTMPAAPNSVFYDGLSLIQFHTGNGEVSVGPALERAPIRRFVSAIDWWTEEVFVLEKNRLSRRKIVLSAANQDGGAHVDATLDQQYVEFKRAIWSTGPDATVVYDIPEPQLVFLRQMAYELLNSPSLDDLVNNGSVSLQNSTVTVAQSPWEPESVSEAELFAMTVSEVNRLRSVVLEGHFSLLHNLYRSSPNSATNPLGNFEIDQRAGYCGLMDDWLKIIVDEGLVLESSFGRGLYTSTARGRAFVARIIEIGR